MEMSSISLEYREYFRPRISGEKCGIPYIKKRNFSFLCREKHKIPFNTEKNLYLENKEIAFKPEIEFKPEIDLGLENKEIPFKLEIDLGLESNELFQRLYIYPDKWWIIFIVAITIISILSWVFYVRPNFSGTGWEDDQGFPIPWLKPNGGADMPGKNLGLNPKPQVNLPQPLTPPEPKKPSGFRDPGLPKN